MYPTANPTVGTTPSISPTVLPQDPTSTVESPTDAPLFVYIQFGLTLNGFDAAAFNTDLQSTFVSALAVYLEIEQTQVLILAVTSKSTRRQLQAQGSAELLLGVLIDPSK